jgi:rubrerythrin
MPQLLINGGFMAMNANDLNSCLRGELAAAETYEQALNKMQKEYGTDPKFQQLAEIKRHHQDAASKLKSLIQQHGGTPQTDSGAWGAWSNTVMGAARLFGDRSALKALKEGEESGIKQYQGILDDANVPADVRNTIGNLMQRSQEHVRQLDQMMDTLETA